MTQDPPRDGDDHYRNPYAAPLAEEPRGPFAPAASGPLLNPWASIWTQPRATIRQIVQTDPRYMLAPIVLAMGASAGLGGAADVVSDPNVAALGMSAMAGAVVAFVAGLIFMPLAWLLNSWLVSITARWIGGQATLREMQAAYAWGSVPSVFTIPVSLTVLMLAFQLQGAPLAGLIALSGLAEAVLGVWSFVALCKCIGEVSQFSAWKGWGAMILAGLLIVVPVMVIVLLGVGVALSL